jgi:chromosome segregation ATPase
MDVSHDISEEEARADNTAIMDELRNRLRKAETASEEYQRQLSMLQIRLNDTLLAHGALEDRLQESVKKIETLENEKIQAAREKREMENQFDAERVAVMKDKEEHKLIEEELQSANQRLKDALAQREARYVDEEKGPERSREY